MKNSQNKRICKVMAFAALGVAQAACISAAGTEQLPTDAQRTALQEMTQRKPDAGMLQNEWRDRQRVTASQIANGSGSVQIQEGQKPALNMDTTTKVRVNEFKITGQDVVEDQKLQELLADKKGKDLTFADLQQGADTLTQYFRSRGYLIAKTYLPAQDVSDGVVTYDVIIGRIDDVTIQNHTGQKSGNGQHHTEHISDKALYRQTKFMKHGDYVTRTNLERAVWLLSDLAEADAKVTLSPGSEPGTVHVLIDVEPYQSKHGLISGDNYGSRSMGYNEYGIDYDFRNLAHEGDHLMTGVSTSGRHMFDWGANYTIPVIQDGLKMTVGYNVLSYDLGDEYSYLDGVGRSRVASLGFDYAIDRGRRHNLYTGVRYEHSQIKDEYRRFGATYGDKTGNAMVFSLYGDDQDTAGTTNWRVDYKWGHITNKSLYSSNPYDQWLADSPRTAGTYEKLRGYIERHQNINERLYLLLTAQGQYAFSNLDSSEHFSLGGPYGVKAYPTSEASGDTGYLTRAELRWLLPLKKHEQQLQLAAYLEHGGIWINKDSSINPGAKNHRNLQGIGVGLIWQRYQDWFVRMDYAWPLGAEEPISDRSHTNGHFWIRTGFYF